MNNTEEVYKTLCMFVSDINEHLPTLKKYAKECEHVTEMGVRWVVSTYAFATAKPKKFISIDIVDPRQLTKETSHWDNYQCGKRIEQIIDYCSSNMVDYKFVLGDTTQMEIEETDLLFIDTLHTYKQIKIELDLHGNKAKKYLIFHDTENFRYRDETGENGESGKTGIWPAIEEFLADNPHWKVHEIFTNCNGLTILKRD